uniref:Uncharacterized protein n=1 Tax=Ditylenchus dipsaci TaxID=166011 RepID=A0A915ELM6_9BILA
MNEFDMLAAASAGYMAGIFSGGGRYWISGLFGCCGIGERASHVENDPPNNTPMLRKTTLPGAKEWLVICSPQQLQQLIQVQQWIHRWQTVVEPKDFEDRSFAQMHPIGAGNQAQPNRAAHRFLTRILDESLFPEMNMYRPFDEMHHNSHEASAEHRMAEAFVPYFLDRITDQTRMMDAQSVQYINLIVASYLTSELTPPPPVATSAEPATSTAAAADQNLSPPSLNQHPKMST